MTNCSGLGEEEAAPESHVFGDPDPFNGTSFLNDLPGPVHSTPAPAAPSPAASSPAAPSPADPSPAAPSLTEEQRKRMELNRQRALERKLARQQQQHTGERKNKIYSDLPANDSCKPQPIKNKMHEDNSTNGEASSSLKI